MIHEPLKIGIGGVRGIVGETFTPELVVRFSQAFATYVGVGRILVCRDTRQSGPMVNAAVLASLLASGCEVIDLGVCPTPSLQVAVTWFDAQGGISITAGHNPSSWNALKFVRGDGLYLNAAQSEELLDIYHQGEFLKVQWDHIQTGIRSEDAIQHHMEVINSHFASDAIRERHLTVALDCCNGACALLTPRWLKDLGCDVLSINDNPNAPFPHSPEPKAETMAQLSAVVKAGRADIGFSHDADGERLGIVTGNGIALSEEMTFVLASQIKLSQKAGPVVTNFSTSGAIEQVASRHGASVVRTPVGQAYISEAIVEYQAVIGGEGSGGVANPEVLATNDSVATIALILERMAQKDESVLELTQQLPQLTMFKHNVLVEPNRIYSILHALRNRVESDHALVYDLMDGIKITWPDGWVHVRVSNTESMIRIIAESEDPRRAGDLLAWARDRVRK